MYIGFLIKFNNHTYKCESTIGYQNGKACVTKERYDDVMQSQVAVYIPRLYTYFVSYMLQCLLTNQHC